MADKEISPEMATYQANKKLVAKLSDPKAMVDHLTTATGNLSRAAPNITQGLHQAVMSGQQFMQSKIPQPQTSLPFSKEFKPNRSQVAKFNSYLETLNDPVGVLGHVKKGTLRQEHLEALSAVYPKLLEEMRQKVAEHMDLEKGKNLPYATKIAIAKFMGQPMDANMLPQNIMANQAALSGPRLAGNTQAPSGKTTLGGLKELKLASRAETEGQEDNDEN